MFARPVECCGMNHQVPTVPIAGSDGYRYVFMLRGTGSLEGEHPSDQVPAKVVKSFNKLAPVHGFQAPFDGSKHSVMRESL